MTSWCSGDVLLGPLAHHLTLRHLCSPVDDYVVVHAKLYVGVDSFTITHTVTAHVTTTNIVFTGSLVLSVWDKPVACSEDGLISKDATHGLGIISPDLMYRTRSLRIVDSIWAVLPLLPCVTESVG